MPRGMNRSGCCCHHSSTIQSLYARVVARPSSGSSRGRVTRPQKPVIIDGKFTDGPDAAEVHVVDARVRVVAARSHLVEAEGLHPVAARDAGRRPRSSRTGSARTPRTPRPRGPTSFTTIFGARSWSFAGSRPSNMSRGSTRWSSTEMTVYLTSAGSGSGRNSSGSSTRLIVDTPLRRDGSSLPPCARGEQPPSGTSPTMTSERR